jgi:hypothetical protein
MHLVADQNCIIVLGVIVTLLVTPTQLPLASRVARDTRPRF